MKNNDRMTKLKLNTVTSLFYQFISIIVGFILPRLFLQYYGSSVNGLVSSITQFLGFIALMELGVGAVIQSTLYKPLARYDKVEISRIVRSAQKFFNKIAMLFLIYLLGLIIVYPSFSSQFEFIFTATLILILAISLIAQYFFGITYRLLITADQKSYIPNLIATITIILNSILSIILIRNGSSIHLVKLVSAMVLLLQPLAFNIYVKRNYDIDKNIEITEEPIKQKWNGIAQHIASFVLNNTDIIVLTIFSDLINVSIYTVYNLVVSGIKILIMSSITGIQALFGNMLANEEYNSLKKRFSQFEWLIHTLVTLLFTTTGVLILPFISIYTKGITDANYIQPLFGSLLTLAIGVYCLRLPYNIMVLASGDFKETQASAIIEMIINIVISVVLVSKLGLVGVAIGTLSAMTYRTIYLAYYLSNNIINHKFSNFLKHIMVDILSVLIIIVATINMNLAVSSYLGWLTLAFKIFLIALAIISVVNIIFYKKYLLAVISKIRRKFQV